MRLWHKNLINILPKNQLLGQYRELCAIIDDMHREVYGEKKKGSYACNHPLVSYCKKDLSSLYTYMFHISEEFDIRGFNMNTLGYLKRISKLEDIANKTLQPLHYVETSNMFVDIHNDEYMTICFMNLYEKYIRGMIKEKEWSKLRKVYDER